MKQFLYLDNDIVNSIIAQVGQGIPSEISEESEIGQEKTSGNDVSLSAKGSADGGFWKFFHAEADVEGQYAHSAENASHTTSRELVTLTLHDAAYDLAYKNIKPTYIKEGDEEKHDFGEYVELCTLFDIWDSDYLEGLLDNEAVVEMVKEQDKEKLEFDFKASIETNYNREQRRSNKADLEKKFNDLVNRNEEKYNKLKSLLVILKQVLPYRRMLLSQRNGYIVPLDDDYFRIDPNNLGFKYGGPMTCVGMITNIINKNSVIQDETVSTSIQNSLNNLLFSFLSTEKTKLYVLHPIALYYGR